MGEFLQQSPHLEAYDNPQYFLHLIVTVFPIFIELFLKKRSPLYEALASLAFIILTLTGRTANQLVSLLVYVAWQVILVLSHKIYRKRHNHKWIFYLWVFLFTLPLAWTKLTPLVTTDNHQSSFGFLGISYLTLRAVGTVMEMRDGVLSEFTMQKFLRFLPFMPIFSSGPIDHSKRSSGDHESIPEKAELLNMLEESVHYLMLGFLYKFISAYVFGSSLLPQLKECALQMGGVFDIATFGVMYVYGSDLFFDFTGYSMLVLTISNLTDIKSPVNFNQPFKSRDLKEFWNRWHMSLPFRFRDFVSMCLVKVLVKHKVLKNRDVTSSVTYIVNMLIMSFWYGLTWYYITCGLFHGIGLVINDAWVQKKEKIDRGRRAQDLPPLSDNKWIQAPGIFITSNVMMLSFLLLSGFSDQLRFPKTAGK